jgi:hypothetical protein
VTRRVVTARGRRLVHRRHRAAALGGHHAPLGGVAVDVAHGMHVHHASAHVIDSGSRGGRRPQEHGSDVALLVLG